MIKLLKYYTKKRAYIVGIISLILVLLAVLLYKDGYIYTYKRGELLVDNPQNCPISFYAVLGAILATIIPMFEFNFKMRKVSIDEYYSFPIKREKFYLVKFIIGFLEVLLPMTIFFLYTLIDIAMSDHLFDLIQYFYFYLLSIPVMASIYSIISFVYAKCNTTYDGIINVILIQFVFVILAGTIMEMFNLEQRESFFFIYSPMTRLSVYYGDFMQPSENYTAVSEIYNTLTNISFIVFLVIGIIAFVLLIWCSKYEKSENSMDISNSWFSYKTILPIYIVGITSLIIEAELSFIILIIICAYIVYAIYRRNFKIPLCDIITIASSLVGGVILGVIIC